MSDFDWLQTPRVIGGCSGRVLAVVSGVTTSAGGDQMNMGAVAIKQVLDAATIEQIKTRWRMAEQHLLGASENPDAGELALHAVISHDMPMLLNELRQRKLGILNR